MKAFSIFVNQAVLLAREELINVSPRTYLIARFASLKQQLEQNQLSAQSWENLVGFEDIKVEKEAERAALAEELALVEAVGCETGVYFLPPCSAT